MDEAGKTKIGSTLQRWTRAMKEKPFDSIRHRRLIDTQGEHIIGALQNGTVSTNVFLRRLHNFALDLQWLPAPLLPKHQWPAVKHAEKRAVTSDEHQRVIAREQNPERRAFYECCWHIGGSQGDIAALHAEDIDWNDRTIAFHRKKTKARALISFGDELASVLRALPSSGPLFPSLAKVQSKDRGNEFRQRCHLLGITGITLHSYRYSWAERAKSAGMPEGFAQQALGHGSKAVARAYAKKAIVKVPSLEDYETKIIQMPKVTAA